MTANRRGEQTHIGALMPLPDTAEPVIVPCDGCGRPTEVGWAGQEVTRRFGGKPPALCGGCYEERRGREQALAVATSHADAACWKALRKDWLATNDAATHERLAARLMAQVGQKEIYAQLLAAWREKRGSGARGARKADSNAGF